MGETPVRAEATKIKGVQRTYEIAPENTTTRSMIGAIGLSASYCVARCLGSSPFRMWEPSRGNMGIRLKMPRARAMKMLKRFEDIGRYAVSVAALLVCLVSLSQAQQNAPFNIDTTIVYVPAADYQYSSSIAFDGTNYLIVWAGGGIHGARVSPSGTILDPAGITISTAGKSPAVSFDGTNYLVVWEDYRSGTYNPDIYGIRVSPSGTVDSIEIAISTAASYQLHPSVAFNGTNYLVVWRDNRNDYGDIYGTRVSPSGVVLDPDGIPISTAANKQDHPRIASNGTDYFVVWGDLRNGANTYGARIDSLGGVLDPEGILISRGGL